MTFFTETEQKNPKIYMEPQKNRNSQNNPEGKEQSWRYYILWSKLCYKTIVIKQHDIDRKIDINVTELRV